MSNELSKVGAAVGSVAVVSGIVLLLGGLVGGCAFGWPAYSRYQAREDAANNVRVTAIQIQNTDQLIEVEKKKAEVRVAEAHGIAESQAIISTSLTSNYLQYLAIGAQKEMAHSPNHTQVYIPSGPNGIPLVKNVEPTMTVPPEKDK
jgi:hypothetical protein